MVLRQHRRTIAVALALAALCSTPASARQKNTVVGTVHTIEGAPLGDVTVILAQESTVKDTTKRADGVYALGVPSGLKKFDLIFEHPNYLKAFDRRIENRDPPIKRNVVVLTPKSPKAIAALSEQDLDRLIGMSYEAIRERAAHHKGFFESYSRAESSRKSGAEGLPPLARAGLENLTHLLEVARLFAQEGRGFVRSPQKLLTANVLTQKAEEADLLLRQALAIQERLLPPHDPELADTLHAYAELLWDTGQKAEAEKYYRRAQSIRGAGRDPAANAVPASPPE